MKVTFKITKELDGIENIAYDCLEDAFSDIDIYLINNGSDNCDNYDEIYNKLKKEFLYTIIDMARARLSSMEEIKEVCDYDEYPNEPDDLDMGFDPYMGCYTDDC